ncbi:MAG: hypothetical protein AB2L14_16110 [Candidatus Xenobiia bacterium LiM19]
MQGIANLLVPMSQSLSSSTAADETSSLSQTSTAADGTSQATQSSIQSQTSLSISSEARLMNFMSGGTRFNVSEANINVTMTATTDLNKLDDSVDTEIMKLELLLKSIAKDPDDYKRLKSIMTKQIRMARELMSSSGQSNTAGLPAAGRNAAGAAGVESQRVTYQISMNFSRVESQVEIQDVQINMADPLILDMNGEGIQLTPAGRGASFDINGDGKKESTAWVKGGSAFLVMDRNNNGLIDDGTELFGDQHGASNGFQELARFDTCRDNIIDRKDSVFNALKVYQDLNSNGAIDYGEVTSLEKAGVASINLDFTRTDSQQSGNRLIMKGSFTTTDGTKRNIMDALLGYRS